MVLYGFFDLVFLTGFYKSGYKVGKAFLGASVPMVLLMAGMEAIPHIPMLSWLDSAQKEVLTVQLPILLLGLACFCICLLIAYRISAKRFEKVNL